MDLSRNIPYKYSVSKLESMKKTEAYKFEECKKRFKKQMYECIMQMFKQEKKPIDIISSIFEEVNKFGRENEMWKDKMSFSFGLAQKWINMTLKYLWLFGKLPEYMKE